MTSGKDAWSRTKMVHSITVCIAAVVIFFTSIQAAPVKDSATVPRMLFRLRSLKTKVRLDRAEQEDLAFVQALVIKKNPVLSIYGKIDEIVSQPLHGFCPQKSKELSEKPNVNSMSRDQMKLARFM
ncbi:hypothetical protein SeLEV6574_g08475 [Synchytrium endobioticum]|uniref:Uncharacterized protein n=1 Tax=Synchytrium endobioticum TaxID=286115 RepID=A0A507BT98_9FUNG|nr:hypothetical protein SeLEV6574_g08475 [Synchytrium endobioticum]